MHLCLWSCGLESSIADMFALIYWTQLLQEEQHLTLQPDNDSLYALVFQLCLQFGAKQVL